MLGDFVTNAQLVALERFDGHKIGMRSGHLLVKTAFKSGMLEL